METNNKKTIENLWKKTPQIQIYIHTTTTTKTVYKTMVEKANDAEPNRFGVFFFQLDFFSVPSSAEFCGLCCYCWLVISIFFYFLKYLRVLHALFFSVFVCVSVKCVRINRSTTIIIIIMIQNCCCRQAFDLNFFLLLLKLKCPLG